MTSTVHQNKPRQRRRERKPVLRLMAALLALIVWAALGFAGYWYAKEYVNTTIRDVQETNALHVQALQDRLETLSQRLEEIERALATADDTIARSSITQEELNRRITELDQQLQQLEESLKILKESSDGFSQ